MRIISLFVYFIFFSGHVIAGISSDSIKVKKYDPARMSREFVIDLSLNQISGQPKLFNLNTFGSRGINLFYYHRFAIGGEKFSFNPGIGLGSDNYNFENKNLNFTPSDTLGYVLEPSPLLSYKKSKISANYIDAPLEFRFRSSTIKSKSFLFGLGLKGGILISSKSKQKFERSNVVFKHKQSTENYLNRFRYGFIGRIGFSRFHLFGYYSLSELFKKNKGPEDIVPWSFGITISTL